MSRAAAWPETSDADLAQDLAHCLDQVQLLEKGIERLRARLADSSGDGPERGATNASDETLTHRLSIQEQMRDLTAAYAEALRRHRETDSPPGS